MAVRTVDARLKLFTKITKEAAKRFGIKPYEVTTAQFQFVSNGRLAIKSLAILGGFSAVQIYKFGAKPNQHNVDISAVRRIIDYAKKQA